MEAKTARFLDEFSRVVFQQWQQQAAASSSAKAPRFWRDAERLRNVLQDAAAKLPRGPLKAELTRELEKQAAALGKLLDALDKAQAAPEVGHKQQQHKEQSHALLNEADVERALTLHETAALAGICAVDDKQESDKQEGVERLEKLAAQFSAVLARQYESKAEQRSKCGAIAKRVAQTVEAIASKWIAQSQWVVDASMEESTAVKELATVRRVLHGLVQLDAVLASASDDATTTLAAPWTAFYRPEPRKSDVSVDYDAEMAAVFAWVAALAVNFPVERDAESDNSDSEDDSDATSDDDDENVASSKRSPSRSLLDTLDAVPMAQFAAQRVVFAAQQRGRRAQLVGGADRAWLVRVLTRLSVLPKPSSYRNTDEDEDAGLSSDDWRAIWDCVGALYTHALAVPSALFDVSESDADAIRAVVCVRQATLFMRTQRKQTLPAVSAASATLARVPLPRSFTKWIVEAKRQLRGKAGHEDLLSAVRQLSDRARAGFGASNSNDQPKASVLLSEANVALDKLLTMQQVRLACLCVVDVLDGRSEAHGVCCWLLSELRGLS